MLLLLGTLLQLLTAINLSAYKENLQPFAKVDIFTVLSMTNSMELSPS
jgi:hypothetical protein